MKPQNRAERALTLLERRYPGWVPAIEFEEPCGRQAWRTALSEARTKAKAAGGDVVNRCRNMRSRDGMRRWVLSEYRLVRAGEQPSVPPQGHDTNQWSLR